jgi:hypothetical protein
MELKQDVQGEIYYALYSLKTYRNNEVSPHRQAWAQQSATTHFNTFNANAVSSWKSAEGKAFAEYTPEALFEFLAKEYRKFDNAHNKAMLNKYLSKTY